MKTAVILHGTLGSPESNWFAWLKGELESAGYAVWLPQLPHAEQPSLQEWLDFVQTEMPFPFDEDTVIIGHSSGAILALLIAQESTMRLKAVICVSVFTNECGESTATNWQANERLFDVSFEWQQVTANVQGQIVLIHSDDDPYVPLPQAEYIAAKVSAELVIIPGQGHFNLEKSPAFNQFPQLTEELSKRHLLIKNEPQELWQGYNELLECTDDALRPDQTASGALHGASHVWLWRKSGSTVEILLQQRAKDKRTWPGFWDISAAGHIDFGESPLQAALREAKEELGITLGAEIMGEPFTYRTCLRSENTPVTIENEVQFVYVVGLIGHETITPQVSELDAVRWFSLEEFHELMGSTNPQYQIVPHGHDYFGKVLEYVAKASV
ncbi:MAG: alpha/beta fold hydrolase [Candidatus Saccharimonadales bacterium]